MASQFGKRLAAGLLCALLLTVQGGTVFAAEDAVAAEEEGAAASGTTEDYKQQINDLNSQIAAIRKEQQAIQASIDKTKNDKDKVTKQKKELQNQIYLAQQEIELLQQRIGGLEGNILQKEQEVREKQAEIDDNYDLYKERLRAMYQKDNASSLGVVLGAESYTDFLSQAEMTRRLSEHDNELINSLVRAKQEMEAALEEIRVAKAQVEEDKADMDAQKANLNVKVQEVAKQEMQLADLEKEFEAQKAQKLQEEKEAQAEIDRIYKENESIGDYVGGDFQWPVTGYRTITSAFGWRFRNTDYHTGVDIAGRNYAGTVIYRQPIRAANSGTVIYASNSYTPGRGYGRYIMIDHGGGYSTLYGHSDQVIVNKGDEVEQGQVIGYVGTTGWSTGPHLHFEIRVNGTAQNPMNYFH